MIKKFDEFVQSLTESRMTKNDNIKYAKDVIKEMLNCIKNKKETSDKLKELNSDKKCLIISGRPGIGKTRIIDDVIKETGAAEKSDYIMINSAKINLKEILSENKGKLIIFDDTNLKFDGENVVTFKRIVDDKEFNSFIVIVTNDLKSIADKSHFNEIISRCSIVDLEMDNEDAWEFIKDVLENQKEDKNLSDEERLLPLKGKAEDSDIDNVISYIDSVIKEKQVNISFREIVLIGHIVRTTDDWKESISKRLKVFER